MRRLLNGIGRQERNGENCRQIPCQDAAAGFPGKKFPQFALRIGGLARNTPAFIVRANPNSARLMSWLRLLFVWWRGATLGTMFATWWSGQYVGEDQFGNRYYQNRAGTRRWVIYNGTAEASRVPPEWHGWLHRTFRDPPTVAPLRVKSWEKQHVPNLTGTDAAYHPAGSLAGEGRHAPATGDYQPWVPD